MKEKVIEGLFGKGGLFRVRGIAFLSLVGGLIYLTVIGSVPIEAYLSITTAVGGAYTVVRAVQERNK
ncbi:hypothetical protein LCGC14_2344620 [marine sediment metagenome]|uniref:Uncharacterized protein n=1 Tax=marine sediment metagenome TaxID=412755 RepID=A0A0F9CYG0_9ZZZZ